MQFRRFLLLTLAALAVSLCSRKEALPPDVIARVGTRMVTLADFKRYLERNAGTELAQIAPEASGALLEQYIEEIALSEYAARRGFEVPAERVAAAVRSEPGSTIIEKRDQLRRERLLREIAPRQPQPEQIRAYFQAHPDEFRLGERVHARQILVHDEQLARRIIADLARGADFNELSKKHSSAPNAARGGDIGFVGRGDLPKIFEDVIFSLGEGEVSRIIRTDSSFHIFKVEEHRMPEQVEFATAEPLIRTRLMEEAARKELAAILDQARRNVPVTILTKRLPFAYSGSLRTSANE